MAQHQWIVVLVIVVLNALSLVDGFFTAAELGLGIASEGNPVLLAAGRQHPALAVALKLGALIIVSIIVWHGRRRRLILGLSLVALAAFAAVVAYHWGTLRGLGWI